MRINKRNYIKKEFDVVVVGGGLTGICAALASARNGAKTALIHDRPVLGGNASSEIRLHICGASANMRKPELSEGGIVHELILANKRLNDSHNFSIWDAVLFDSIKKEKNLTLFLNTSMIDSVCEENTVKAVQCYQLTTESHIELSARFFADCTGNGSLCAFSGAEFRIGTEGKDEFNEPHAPEQANNDRMGNTLLFKAIDKGHPVKFVPPVEIIHFTEEQLKYRKHCAVITKDMIKNADEEEIKRMFDGFCLDYGYWWIEIPGEKENIIEEYEDIRDTLVASIYGIWDHIKNGGEHGAENYELIWVGMLPGMRESRRIECDYMLNETDVLENRRFQDKVAYGGWWVDDNHFGLFDFDHVPSFTFEVKGSYDIPYRSYCVKDFKNLYVGGRCMGATKFAMASTRVMGTCAVGGQAIGTAAALLCTSGKSDIRDVDINKLQQTLMKDDCYLPGIFNKDEKDIALKSTVIASSEQNAYPAENIINGVTRAIDGKNNQWRSKEIKFPHWIELKLKEASKVGSVHLVFDSNFEIEKKITMSSRRQNQQVPGIPKELVRDYDITLLLKGKEVCHKKIRGNFQRMNNISFEPTFCDSVKIDVLSTNGDLCAKIFEVRIYE